MKTEQAVKWMRSTGRSLILELDQQTTISIRWCYDTDRVVDRRGAPVRLVPGQYQDVTPARKPNDDNQ